MTPASRRQLCTVVEASTFDRLDATARRLTLAKGRRVTKQELVDAALRYHLSRIEDLPARHGGLDS
jgi:hypothetical protein